MSGKFRLDDKIDFQNMSTKCIDSMVDCIENIHKHRADAHFSGIRDKMFNLQHMLLI